MTGTRARVGHYHGMIQPSKSDRLRARAERLRREAGNCISIAVAGRDPSHVASLIDEAALLTRRAAELSTV